MGVSPAFEPTGGSVFADGQARPRSRDESSVWYHSRKKMTNQNRIILNSMLVVSQTNQNHFEIILSSYVKGAGWKVCRRRTNTDTEGTILLLQVIC